MSGPRITGMFQINLHNFLDNRQSSSCWILKWIYMACCFYYQDKQNLEIKTSLPNIYLLACIFFFVLNTSLTYNFKFIMMPLASVHATWQLTCHYKASVMYILCASHLLIHFSKGNERNFYSIILTLEVHSFIKPYRSLLQKKKKMERMKNNNTEEQCAMLSWTYNLP